MKRQIVFWAAFCMAFYVQAKIFRVNNVAGMAPYQTINDAVKAASEGDTIIVDGAVEPYREAVIDKQLVIVGPGYFLTENGSSTVNNLPAKVNGMKIEKAGVTVMGIYFNSMYKFYVMAPNIVITRCFIDSDTGASIRDSEANNCVFHQNCFGEYANFDCGGTYNHQFTNNIFIRGYVNNLRDSYVAHNTFCLNEELSTWNNEGNTFEKNIVLGWESSKWRESNTYLDNYAFVDGAYLVNRDYPDTDMQVLERTQALSGVDEYGAFAGNEPYRLSGIPAGPVIEELTLPASVEEGADLNVTVKLGLQQ